jgi:hypothetical protein
MQTPRTPANKQASMFLSRHRRCETVQEAFEGAVTHLLSGKLKDQLADVFSGGFGPEPWVSFQITVRRDPKEPGSFAYSSSTKVGHEIGNPVSLYGLKPTTKPE